MPSPKADLSIKRLKDLAEAGLAVFCRQGYERSQMADVAKAMGVAVGTVYLYVSGKEALFDFVVRHASAEDTTSLGQLEIPLPKPPPGSTLAFLKEAFASTEWPLLHAALASARADDPAAELAGVIREQYALMRRHRRGLLLLKKSALEFPGLEEVFVHGLRAKLLDHLSRYVSLRVEGRQFRRPADIFATVAALTQSVTWANLERPHDPGLAAVSDETMETATVDLFVHALLA